MRACTLTWLVVIERSRVTMFFGIMVSKGCTCCSRWWPVGDVQSISQAETSLLFRRIMECIPTKLGKGGWWPAGQCVPKFDHFCPLLATAIGSQNAARFLFFCSIQTFLVTWGVILAVHALLPALALWTPTAVRWPSFLQQRKSFVHPQAAGEDTCIDVHVAEHVLCGSPPLVLKQAGAARAWDSSPFLCCLAPLEHGSLWTESRVGVTEFVTACGFFVIFLRPLSGVICTS